MKFLNYFLASPFVFFKLKGNLLQKGKKMFGTNFFSMRTLSVVCVIASMAFAANGNFDENFLQILGVKVDNSNASDVFGDGHVSYDFESKTLILNDAQIGDGSKSGYPACLISSFDTLKIVLHGKSVVNCGLESSVVVNALVVDGDGALSIGGKGASIEASKSLTVVNGSLTAYSAENKGISAYEMEVLGGSVVATGTNGISVCTMRIRGGSVTVDALSNDGGIVADEIHLTGGNFIALASSKGVDVRSLYVEGGNMTCRVTKSNCVYAESIYQYSGEIDVEAQSTGVVAHEGVFYSGKIKTSSMTDVGFFAEKVSIYDGDIEAFGGAYSVMFSTVEFDGKYARSILVGDDAESVEKVNDLEPKNQSRKYLHIVPKSSSDEVPESSSGEVPESSSDEVPESSSGEVPESSSDEVPESSSDEVPESSSGEVPESSSDEVPESSSDEVPESSSGEVPESSSGEVPESSSDEMPESSSGEVPESSSDEMPEFNGKNLEFVKGSQFNAFAQGMSIQIAGAHVGKVFAVYDVRGFVIRWGIVESANFALPVMNSGMYVVRVERAIRTVQVR